MNSAAGPMAEPGGGPVVRIATYNVRSLRDDAGALARVVRGMRADLLCVQEAPRMPGWRGRRHRMARAAGMTVLAGRRRGGMAILAGPRVTPLHAESHLLPRLLGLERRAVVVAVVEVGGVRLAVGGLHLDLHAAVRLRTAMRITALVEGVASRFGARAVLAGDVNEQPDGLTWRYLAGRFTDCFAAAPRGHGCTFPARRPDKRIDAVFAGAAREAVLGAGVPEGDPADLAGASDHLPVVAELVLGADPVFHGDLTRDLSAPGAATRTICS